MIGIIIGTRPEIIKMSPIIMECERKNLDYLLIHTGQHFSYNMDQIFFDELELPDPHYSLDVGTKYSTQGTQTGEMIKEIEKILLKEKERLNFVLVQGDTNTVLAGALASAKLHICVGHVEAGLRSYDRKMPEEINRIVTDHVSDYLFSPTEISKKNLLKEGIPENRIFITGNTIVDAVYQNLEIANRKVDILKKFNLKPKDYFLVTTHRQENVDIKERLKGIIEGLELLYERFSISIIFPVHPRTKNKIREFNLTMSGINIIPPVSFLEFLQLEANARLVITDSGGVQEETCILKVPCITLRDNTERPETIKSGSNILVGANPTKILDGVELMLNRENNWENPFGDGKAGKRIIQVIEQKGFYVI